MKLLISVFIGFLAISISLQDDVATPAAEFPDFCSNPSLNKNAKVKACCMAVTEAANAGTYKGADGPVPDKCTLRSCGRVCNRFFNQKGNDVTEMPGSTTAEFPDFCSNPDLNKNAKVKACCEAVTEAANAGSYGGRDGPVPDECTLRSCGRVCNRFFNQKGNDVTEMPESTTTESESSEECECGDSEDETTTEAPPTPRNPYPSGPEPTPKQPGYPQAPASTPKQPGYPQAPASPTPRNPYPSGPEPSTPGGQVASHKPPAAPSTPQPGYPQPPAAASTKPPRNPYPSGPEPTPKQPGYPQAPASTPQPGYPQPPAAPSTKPPRNPYPSGPEDLPTTKKPVNITTTLTPRRNRYPVGPPE